MGGGISVSSSSSEQSAQAFLSQQFSGSCNITCTNTMNNINIDIINSVVGGNVSLTQSCSVDASCMISGSSDASSDVMFKAANSTNAKNASAPFSFDADFASSSSRQDIKQSILQNTTQTCKMASLNQMSDITILAANSVIGGNIAIGQTGSVAGQCQLKNNLSAAATATALASNTATSGKDKKGSKKGGSAVLIGIFIVLGICIAVYIGAKMYTGSRDSAAEQSYMDTVNDVKAAAGCSGGKKALTNPTTGKFLFDKITGKPVCPPIEFPTSQKLEINLSEGSNALQSTLAKAK
jgi:hypothetical protein